MNAFEEAVMDAAGVDPFARGSATEVAKRLNDAIVRVSGHPLVFDLGSLWRYDPPSGVWLEVDSSSVTRMVGEFDGFEVMENEKAKKLKVGGTLWRDTETKLRAEPDKERGSFFKDSPRGLAFSNGFLQVSKEGGARLVPHSAEHRCRHAYPIPWSRAAECRRWLDALDDWGLPREDQAYLQEWVGTALVGLATKGGRLLILMGGGANGKSTCMSVIQGLFPDHWRSAIGPQTIGEKFGAAALVGARLNCVADIEHRDLLHPGTLKAVVTGDEIPAERKHRDSFKFVPEAGHLFGLNPPRPAVSDDSDGFWRRMSIIQFNRTFPDGVAVSGLAESILAEELPGLVAWAIEGALARLTRGWTKRSDDAVAEWRREENPVATWMDERCATTGWTPAHRLYTAFSGWASERKNGAGIGSKTFSQKLVALLGADKKRRTPNGVEFYIESRLPM